jgi:hypothetical protein
MSSKSTQRRPRFRRSINPSGSKKDTTGTDRIQACRKVFGNPSESEVFTWMRERSNQSPTAS